MRDVCFLFFFVLIELLSIHYVYCSRRCEHKSIVYHETETTIYVRNYYNVEIMWLEQFETKTLFIVMVAARYHV
jgi:hypothetical protein